MSANRDPGGGGGGGGHPRDPPGGGAAAVLRHTDGQAMNVLWRGWLIKAGAKNKRWKRR